MVGLSFPARLRVGSEGARGSSSDTPNTDRERRVLRVWRHELYAFVAATFASPGSPSVHLLQLAKQRGSGLACLGRTHSGLSSGVKFIQPRILKPPFAREFHEFAHFYWALGASVSETVSRCG